jgi:DNA gyrase subunit A
MVRMAQDFSMRVPLIDGQGNFGSWIGDHAGGDALHRSAPRQGRAVAARRHRQGHGRFQSNYDGSFREPAVLPARFPICWSTAPAASPSAWRPTSRRTISAKSSTPAWPISTMADISVEELMEIVPGPDFPTGAIILGRSGCRSAYQTGRGSIIVRCRHTFEQRGERRSIVLTEIPYQQGKNALVEKIAEAAKDKRIEGVSDIRDESSREGVRIVIDLKRDATPEVVLNQLWRNTPAQSSFPANMLAIRGGRPELLNLRDIIEAFVKFREEVITRRSKFELAKARERAHILLGLAIAVTNLDEVVKIIRSSPEPGGRPRPAADARMADRRDRALYPPGRGDRYRGHRRQLSPVDTQVRAILDLRLHRLTALGRDEIGDELAKLAETITELLEILANRARLYEVMVEELVQVRDPSPPRADRDRRRCRRHRRRGPDRARGHGRHRDHGRLYQAHPA